MSLFNDLQGELIEKPRQKGSYHKVLKAKEEETKTKKEIAKEMKEKMGEDAYRDWYRKEYYKEKREDIKKRYQEKKMEEELLVGELIDEIYADVPEPINRDEYYTQKFRDDDTVKNGYRFARRSSKLKNLNRSYIPKQKKPFRISNRRSMEYSMRLLHNIQCEVYEYLLPHIDEIRNCKISLYKKQKPYDFPLWCIDEPLKTLASGLDMNPARVVNVADAMIRGKLIVSELYLGRNSFIFGDVLVTQTGNTYRIALENNLHWLTKDTVEEIHKKRMERSRDMHKDRPPIYIVNDAYLVRYEPNEREKIFYIIPT